MGFAVKSASRRGRRGATFAIGLSIVSLAALAGAVPAAKAEVGVGGQASAGIPPCMDPRLSPELASAPCTAILSFEAGVSASDRAAAVRGSGAAVRHDFERLNATSVVVPTLAALDRLAGEPMIARIIPNRRVHAAKPPEGKGKPGGGGGGGQVVPEGVERIGSRSANEAGFTGAGVDVFVADTGIDRNHADLAGAVGGACFNAFDDLDMDCLDDNGHGTHVAGIVGARDNDLDVVGVAPGVTLYSVKVLDATGVGGDDDVMAGLDWVLENADGPAVVNMSLGRFGDCARPDNPLLRRSIDALVAAGIPVVVAAGNDNGEDVADVVPAGCPGVIAVASTTALQGRNKCKVLSGSGVAPNTASYFSNQGEGVVVSAPGEAKEDNTCGTIQFIGITSLASGGGVTGKAGTSMAAPHVAGVAALMLDGDGALLPEDIRSAIEASADGVGTLPLDHPFATRNDDGEREGVIDACAAVGGC